MACTMNYEMGNLHYRLLNYGAYGSTCHVKMKMDEGKTQVTEKAVKREETEKQKNSIIMQMQLTKHFISIA